MFTLGKVQNKYKLEYKMKIKPVKIVHTIQRVEEAKSEVTHRIIPAHERHSLTVGTMAVHGCASLTAAQHLMAGRLHTVQ